MQKKTGWIAAGAIGLATIGGATGIATASGGGDHAAHDANTAITGPAYDQATSVALRTAGGGKVTETEKGDEESYYQVEVTRADGTVMDVNLNRSFKVVKTKTEAGETKDDRKDAGGHEDGKTDGETKDDGPQG